MAAASRIAIRTLFQACAATLLTAIGLALPGPSVNAQTTDPITQAIKDFIAGGPQAASEDRTTRFEILVPSKVTFRVQALSAPTNRVLVDIPTTTMVLPDQKTTGRPGSLVKSFVGGLSAPGYSRVVIEVTEPVVVQKQEIEKTGDSNAHVIALELIPVSTLTRTNAARAELFATPPHGLGAGVIQPPLPAPAVRLEALIAKAFKPTIVIDPGHGGHDSGATKFGAIEKDVVLAFSKVLRRQLEATGRYKVMMTRETDVFIPLDDRREYAEKQNAALFIAVHADYADRTSARGATIYSLRDNVANRLKRSAKGDVAGDVLSPSELKAVRQTGADGSSVTKILKDLAVREVDTTQRRTNLFSETVIENMGSATELRGRPHQSAAFRVLKTAKVPSVLIELAYVSNQADARLLRSQNWREKVAGSIREAVDNYFAKARNATVASRK